MPAQFAQSFLRKGPDIGGSRIRGDMLGASHARNDRRHGRMGEAEAQRDFRHARPCRCQDRPRWPALARQASCLRPPARVRVAESRPQGTVRVGRDLAGQAAFVERHTRDHTDALLSGSTENSSSSGDSIEGVVDHLHGRQSGPSRAPSAHSPAGGSGSEMPTNLALPDDFIS